MAGSAEFSFAFSGFAAGASAGGCCSGKLAAWVLACLLKRLLVVTRLLMLVASAAAPFKVKIAAFRRRLTLGFYRLRALSRSMPRDERRPTSLVMQGPQRRTATVVDFRPQKPPETPMAASVGSSTPGDDLSCPGRPKHSRGDLHYSEESLTLLKHRSPQWPGAFQGTRKVS